MTMSDLQGSSTPDAFALQCHVVFAATYRNVLQDAAKKSLTSDALQRRMAPQRIRCERPFNVQWRNELARRPRSTVMSES